MTALEFKEKYRDPEPRDRLAAANLEHLTRVLTHVAGGNGLEIGCFEGRLTCWLLRTLRRVDVVDHFNGSPEHSERDRDHLYERFQKNTEPFADRIGVYPWSSMRALAVLLLKDSRRYDFIYVDGSHNSRDVIADAVLAWPLLKPGGVMVFDDYEWCYYDEACRNPKPAIDFFLCAFADEMEILEKAYQVSVRKRFEGGN